MTFLRKYHKWLSFVGASMVFVTYFIKDGLSARLLRI